MTGAPANVAPTAHEVIHEAGPVRVLRYRPVADEVLPVPVLLVPSIINRPYILDLREGQSLVASLLGRGLDVHLVDWGSPGPCDAGLGLEDYAIRLLGRAIDEVRGRAGADRVHLFGYCLGGTFALVRAARRPGSIATVCCLTTPVDTSEPGPVGRLTDDRLLDLERLADAFPVVPGEMLWAAFQTLDPVGIGTKWRGFAERAPSDPTVRERFLAQETWVGDPVPVTARALRDVVDGLYRRNGLVTGDLEVGGRPVDLAAGTPPVLNLVAERDGIVPPAASLALEELWGGPVESHVLPGGHVGVTVGSRAPENMWRVAGEWLVELQS